MAAVVKAVYNYGVSAYAYDTAKEAHSYKLIPEYGTNYTAAEDTLGKWQTCEYCHKKSYTQYATAVNSSDYKKTTKDGPYEYIYVGGDRTQAKSYQKTDTRAALACTTVNMKPNGSQTYTFKVNVEKTTDYKIIIRMRNTNNNKTNAQGYNEEYQLNKTLTLKVNDTQKTISDDVILKASPEFNGGAVFDEYVLTVENLQAGENIITLTFTRESNDATGKPKGGYLQYMRLEG